MGTMVTELQLTKPHLSGNPRNRHLSPARSSTASTPSPPPQHPSEVTELTHRPSGENKTLGAGGWRLENPPAAPQPPPAHLRPGSGRCWRGPRTQSPRPFLWAGWAWGQPEPSCKPTAICLLQLQVLTPGER